MTRATVPGFHVLIITPCPQNLYLSKAFMSDFHGRRSTLTSFAVAQYAINDCKCVRSVAIIAINLFHVLEV